MEAGTPSRAGTQPPQLQPHLGRQCPALGPPQTTPLRPGPLHQQQQPRLRLQRLLLQLQGTRGLAQG